jgi:uncharacterized protein (TIGR02646 family)
VRYVPRGSKPPPSALTRRTRNKGELDRARDHMKAPLAPGAKRKPFTFKAYKADAVKARLEELFHGKCAYCESFYGSLAPVDVEHYRPKGRVEGEPTHPGYWWVAAIWSNLLPSCLDCNRRRKQRTPTVSGNLTVLYRTMQTGKKDAFPIQGPRASAEGANVAAEKPLLLDPTSDDPDDHLAFWLGDDPASGLIYPKPDAGEVPAAPPLPIAGAGPEAVAAAGAAGGVSVRGAVSIQVFGLNRIRLVQERAQLLQRLRFLETLLVELAAVIDRLEHFNQQPQHAEVIDAVTRLVSLQGRILEEMRSLAKPEAPHAALAKAYLGDFKARINGP